jgi:hypothetical protein
MESIQQILDTSDYWQNATRTVTEERVRWQAGEEDRITIPVGGYLVYNIETGMFKGMSQADYEAAYREVA